MHSLHEQMCSNHCAAQMVFRGLAAVACRTAMRCGVLLAVVVAAAASAVHHAAWQHIGGAGVRLAERQPAAAR
jgi:hypothetical protein